MNESVALFGGPLDGKTVDLRPEFNSTSITIPAYLPEGDSKHRFGLYHVTYTRDQAGVFRFSHKEHR